MPAPNRPDLSGLRLCDRDAWERAFRGALEASGGCRASAARALGVSYRTVWRWLGELEAERAVEGVGQVAGEGGSSSTHVP